MLRFRRTWVAVLAVALAVVIQLAPAAVAVAEEVRVPAGLTVVLAFEDAVSPETAQVGQRVFLRVQEDVVVDDAVVISNGALATGEVSQSVKKGAVGKAAAIGVIVRTVEAVDGTSIPISGTKMIEGESKQSEALIVTILCCILGLLMNGGDAEIAAGSTMDAMVDMGVDVNLE